MSHLVWFSEGVLAMCAVVIAVVTYQRVTEALQQAREEAEAVRPVIHTRWGWCQVCGEKVYDDDLHEVGKVHDDGLDEHGGGSFSVAEFCPKHCPGACTRPHKPAEGWWVKADRHF